MRRADTCNVLRRNTAARTSFPSVSWSPRDSPPDTAPHDTGRVFLWAVGAEGKGSKELDTTARYTPCIHAQRVGGGAGGQETEHVLRRVRHQPPVKFLIWGPGKSCSAVRLFLVTN